MTIRLNDEIADANQRIAMLTTQLADVREYLNRADNRRHELAGECQLLTAQLAEARAKWADADSRNTALRAQLATAKREERIEGFKDGWHDAIERAMDGGLVDLGSFPITGRRKRERTKGEEWAIAGLGANEAASKRYPATPSGAAVCGKCGTPRPAANVCLVCATPSPEAREESFENIARRYVPDNNGEQGCGDGLALLSLNDRVALIRAGAALGFTAPTDDGAEVVLMVEQEIDSRVRITPADAKRIMAMAKVRP